MKKSINYKYDFLLRYFREHNPNAASELVYQNAFELIVAVVLSAQCTDKRVNMVTKELFRQYPTVEKMAQATEQELFELIKSVSYPNNKTKHLSGLSKKLVNDFGGEVPQDMDALQSLPGVGRKSANVILSVIFNRPAMAVDTHVFRVSHRLGIVKNAKTPLETEKQLVAHIQQEDISIAHHWLILHGRYICLARKPKCEECGLTEICNYYGEKEA
jgi:endonuclease-3